eukprot:624281-Pyramimonas_sp.AAC.1
MRSYGIQDCIGIPCDQIGSSGNRIGKGLYRNRYRSSILYDSGRIPIGSSLWGQGHGPREGCAEMNLRWSSRWVCRNEPSVEFPVGPRPRSSRG